MTTVVVVHDDGSSNTYKSVAEMFEAYQRQQLMEKLENVELNWNALTHTTTDRGFDIGIIEVENVNEFIADNATLLRGLL